MDTQGTDPGGRGSFTTSDGNGSDGRDSTGSAGAPPNKAGAKSDGTPYHSRDRGLPHHSALHHDGEGHHGGLSHHPGGHVHFSEGADPGQSLPVPAYSPRGGAGGGPPGPGAWGAPRSSKSGESKSFSFDSFGADPGAVGSTSNGSSNGHAGGDAGHKAQGRSDSKGASPGDGMDVSSTPSVVRPSAGSQYGAHAGRSLSLQQEGPGALSAGRGPGEGHPGAVPPLQKRHERPQSAEKRRWLARVSLLNADSKESMSTHPMVRYTPLPLHSSISTSLRLLLW